MHWDQRQPSWAWPPARSEHTGFGKTGETLIVNKDAVALNELRWRDNAPLKLKISAEPAIRAARGETGITDAGLVHLERLTKLTDVSLHNTGVTTTGIVGSS